MYAPYLHSVSLILLLKWGEGSPLPGSPTRSMRCLKRGSGFPASVQSIPGWPSNHHHHVNKVQHHSGIGKHQGLCPSPDFRIWSSAVRVHTCTLAHTLLYEMLVAGHHTVIGERKTEFTAAYLPVDVTGNIYCCSHSPCTFITLPYRKGDGWEVGTCQLTSGTCPSTTREPRYARGLKFHYRF